MVNYRRIKTGNADDHFFFSIVTEDRKPRFNKPEINTLVLRIMKAVEAESGFQFTA